MGFDFGFFDLIRNEDTKTINDPECEMPSSYSLQTMEEFRIPVEIIDPSGKLQTLITYTKIFCY